MENGGVYSRPRYASADRAYNNGLMARIRSRTQAQTSMVVRLRHHACFDHITMPCTNA